MRFFNFYRYEKLDMRSRSSMQNHGVFDSHDFSWKPGRRGNKRGQMAEGKNQISIQNRGVFDSLAFVSKFDRIKYWTSINKKGQMAEGINMMYRLFMVSLVAFVIFGAGSMAYDYHIDVRDVEAHILAREVVECLAESGVFEVREDFLDECSFAHDDRVFLKVEVFVGEDNVARDTLGDSGALWIKDLFGKVGDLTGSETARDVEGSVQNIVEYEPGYFEGEFFVLVLEEGRTREGVLKVEVLVNNEE